MSSREVLINKDFTLNKRKPHSPHSYNAKNLTVLNADEEDTNDALFKAGVRIDALN
jgi:hypothetical protein